MAARFQGVVWAAIKEGTVVSKVRTMTAVAEGVTTPLRGGKAVIKWEDETNVKGHQIHSPGGLISLANVNA